MKNDIIRSTVSPYIEVCASSIHGKGVFALCNIAAGTKIIEYVGEKISKKEGTRRAEEIWKQSGLVCVFELNKRYDIDGSVDYNKARFINHSCVPNCVIEIPSGHIWIVAQRDIKKGEELTYNYGYDLEDFEDFPCCCGAKCCIGYIAHESEWPKLKELIKKPTQLH